MNTEKSSEAVRRARKELQSKVRSDWDDVLYRALPDPLVAQGSDEKGANPEASAVDSLAESARQGRLAFRRRAARQSKSKKRGTPSTIGGEALEWRERTYASSDPSSEEEESASTVAKMFGLGRRRHPTADEDEEIDTEGEVLDPSLSPEERKRQRRKQRRRRRLEDEMDENPGLRYWEMRRDVWCQAQSFQPPQTHLARPPEASTSSSASNSTSTSNSSLSLTSAAQTRQHLPIQEESSAEATAPYHRPPQLSQLLPVAPPLLPPNDPTRKITSPATYPSIYTKLVTQSLAPSVPINLSHVVPALVQGWKDNGEWPPLAGQTTTTTTTANAMTGEAGTRVHSSRTGIGVMRRLRLVEDAKDKGRRLLGHVTPNSADAGDEDGPGGGSGRASPSLLTPTNGGTASAAEKEGSSTGTPDSASPLKARVNAMREWASHR